MCLCRGLRTIALVHEDIAKNWSKTLCNKCLGYSQVRSVKVKVGGWGVNLVAKRNMYIYIYKHIVSVRVSWAEYER